MPKPSSSTDTFTYPKLKVGVVIGRFNPVHNFHIEKLIRPALESNDYVFILLGSSRSARNSKNPFEHYERSALICRCLSDAELTKVHFAAIQDFPYSDIRWQGACHRQVETLLDSVLISHPDMDKSDVEIRLHGVNKDESSYYLKLFPQWKSVTYETQADTSSVGSTEIREALYKHILGIESEHWQFVSDNYLNRSVCSFLAEWGLTPRGIQIAEEWKFVLDYKKQWESVPYPVIFQTVDNVVIHNGHILMIKRGQQPGRGLWALPGGFVDKDEFLKESAIRELKEETSITFKDSDRKIRISEDWIKSSRTFDYPGRSLRGRTITNAFLWAIPIQYNVNIVAGDDAGDAKWFPVEEVLGPEFENLLFEDHKHIIDYMVKDL